MSGAQDKPLNELLSRSMVDIYVGQENTHWILHEKLLCHHSPFFRKIFYAKGSRTTSHGLPEEEDASFKTFVGWLYSSSLPVPREESDLGLQYDLYLMAEKFQIPNLVADVLQVVREWYKFSDSYPSLRRIQYVYANTEDGSPMRHMLVHSVARMVVLEKGIPAHWDKALRKNGQLAVDIIRAIQDWRLEEERIPDAREDPAEGEELVDVEEETQKLDREAEEEVEGEHGEEDEAEVEAEGEKAEVEAQAEGEDEAEDNKHSNADSESNTDNDEESEKEEDDSEGTVVDSPTSKKFSDKDESAKPNFDQDTPKKADSGNKSPTSKWNKSDDGFKKFRQTSAHLGSLQKA